MINNIHPTRAEVVDITNAVIQGIDGMVLLSETSIGKYWKESTEMMRHICDEAERQFLTKNVN
jgi:pyruvate kinase